MPDGDNHDLGSDRAPQPRAPSRRDFPDARARSCESGRAAFGRRPLRRLGNCSSRRCTWLGCRVGAGLRPGRQKEQRVAITVLVRGQANAKVDVRLGMLHLTTWADGRYGCSFGDSDALLDSDRPEVEKRHSEPVGRCDRQGSPSAGHRPGEGDRTRGRRNHLGSGRCADVDAAVLAPRVGIVAKIELS